MTVTPLRAQPRKLSAWLKSLHLQSGNHNPDGKFCIMEAAAYVAGEKWSDAPKCVSPAITAFLVSWNDSLPDGQRDILKPLIPLVLDTRTNAADEKRRAWMATDWLARVFAPEWLDLAGLHDHAAKLRTLNELTADDVARKAQPIIEDARRASDAAWSAARSAAWSAAWSAASSAARSAARSAASSAASSAARSAARSAASDAASSAAWSAARSAARSSSDEALAPTVKKLQTSAIDLVERMAAVGRAA